MFKAYITSKMKESLKDESGELRLNSKIGEIEALTKEMAIDQWLYKTLFEMSPVAMWIVDPETRRITHYNKVAHETLGYGRKEFKGLSIKDVEAKETDNDIKEHIKRLAIKGYDEFKTEHRTKSGEIKKLCVKTTLIKYNGSQIICTVLIY